MEILQEKFDTICSIWHKGETLDLNHEEFLTLPIFTGKNFKETYCLLPVTGGSLVITKSGLFRHEVTPQKLLEKIFHKDFIKKVTLGLNEIYGKKMCLKPIFSTYECMQALYRHRDNPPVLNLCLISEALEKERRLHIEFQEYQLVLNYPIRSLRSRMERGMFLVKSIHLFISHEILSHEDLSFNHIFSHYSSFVRPYLLSADSNSALWEEVLMKGTQRHAYNEIYKNDWQPLKKKKTFT